MKGVRKLAQVGAALAIVYLAAIGGKQLHGCRNLGIAREIAESREYSEKLKSATEDYASELEKNLSWPNWLNPLDKSGTRPYESFMSYRLKDEE